MRLISAYSKKCSGNDESFLLILEKIIIPELIAIRMANNSVVPVEAFIESLKKMQLEAQSYMIGGEPINRSEFNKFLHFKSIEMQHRAANEKKVRKRMNKKNQDDEDFNIDMESSGEKLVTTVFPTQAPDLNDTTIIFDQQDE